MKKFDVSIGITAYNEEQNIKNILESLLKQTNKYYDLKEIILITDGCSDDTFAIASSVRSKKIRLINEPKRLGQTIRQNQIIKMFKGDILVFIEADTLPAETNTLDYLIKKFYISDSLQVAVGGDIRYFDNSFYGRIQKAGSDFKKQVFLSWNKGQNIYWLGGHSIKAIRRKFARNLSFPKDVPEDTYIYLYAKNQGIPMKRFDDVNMQTGTTKNFCDWVRQSTKFITGKNSLSKYFGQKIVKAEFSIPFFIYLICLFSSLTKNPIWTALYILMLPLNRLYSSKKETMNPRYDIYTSSKEVMKSSKPKVVISNYDDIKNPYYGGGGAISIHEVAKRLVYKYSVIVLTGNYPGARTEKIDGVFYKRTGLLSGGPLIGQLSYSASLPFRVLTEKHDLWIESFTPPFSVGFTPLFTRKPVIALVHMLASKDMQRKYKLPFGIIENLGLKLYKDFIVTSEESKKEIEKANPRANFNIIPNGVDIPAKVNQKGTYILYLGRIEIAQKGLDLLLEAQKNIYNKTNTKLLIAGSGNIAEIDYLRKLIKSHGLNKSVKYIGKVTGSKKIEVLQNAKLVVLPSRFDTYPLVALEAMAYAKPLVIFDIKSLGWIPQNVCLRAKSFDIKSLGQNIIRLINNQKLNKGLAKNARLFAKSRSWNDTAGKYSEVLRNEIKSESDIKKPESKNLYGFYI